MAAIHVVAANIGAVASTVGALVNGLVEGFVARAAIVVEHLDFGVGSLLPVIDHLFYEAGVLVIELIDDFAQVQRYTAKHQAEKDKEA